MKTALAIVCALLLLAVWFTCSEVRQNHRLSAQLTTAQGQLKAAASDSHDNAKALADLRTQVEQLSETITNDALTISQAHADSDYWQNRYNEVKASIASINAKPSSADRIAAYQAWARQQLAIDAVNRAALKQEQDRIDAENARQAEIQRQEQFREDMAQEAAQTERIKANAAMVQAQNPQPAVVVQQLQSVGH